MELARRSKSILLAEVLKERRWMRAKLCCDVDQKLSILLSLILKLFSEWRYYNFYLPQCFLFF